MVLLFIVIAVFITILMIIYIVLFVLYTKNFSVIASVERLVEAKSSTCSRSAGVNAVRVSNAKPSML